MNKISEKWRDFKRWWNSELMPAELIVQWDNCIAWIVIPEAGLTDEALEATKRELGSRLIVYYPPEMVLKR